MKGKINKVKRHGRILYSRFEPSNTEPETIKFLIARHIVKNRDQGDLLLIAILVICMSTSIFLFIYSANPVSISKGAVLSVLLKQ